MKMHTNIGKFVVVALLGSFVLGGCRLKGQESFLSATTPNQEGTWAGDPYASGGIGEASGGTQAATKYGEGARTVGTGPLNPDFDQAAKGVGSQRGEYPVTGAPGFGHSNAPAAQPAPEDATPSG